MDAWEPRIALENVVGGFSELCYGMPAITLSPIFIDNFCIHRVSFLNRRVTFC